MAHRELDPREKRLLIDQNQKQDLGDETGDESSPLPDSNVVDEMGEEVGVNYGDAEPLHTVEKRAQRDEHRWELDPASSEDFSDRERDGKRSAD